MFSKEAKQTLDNAVNESSSLGKLPANKPLRMLDPVSMERGFVRPDDVCICSGRFYINPNVPVTSTQSLAHDFIVPIQNVDCGKFVIQIPESIDSLKTISNFTGLYQISGVSYEQSHKKNLSEIEAV